MTTHKLNGRTILWVEVPQDSILLYEVHGKYLVMDFNMAGIKSKIKKINRGDTKGFYNLPFFDFKFLSLSKDMNEDHAYNLGCTIGLFRSLEQLLNIDSTKNYAILIQS